MAATLYPTTAQYIESLSNAQELLSTLDDLSLATDHFGEPIYSAGGFGVVFKALRGNRELAIKCFTCHQAGRAAAYTEIEEALNSARSPHIADFRYIDGEITIFDASDHAALYPTLCMEWIDGPTLTQAVSSAALHGDKERLSRLADGFDRMALWLLDQNFAHGDIKPDNIMVRDKDGTLVLIDYDGIFLPTMTGERERESGTEGFRHPTRQAMHYDKAIDHYPIALLSLSLRALALDPTLWQRFHSPDKLIFGPADILNHSCEAYNSLRTSTIANNPLYTMLSSPNGHIEGLASAIAQQFEPTTPNVTNSAQYDFLGDPIEGISLFRAMGRYGFVTQSGKTICKTIYESAHNFAHGVAAVSMNGRWGYIDSNGNELVEFHYQECGDFSQGVAAVCIDGKWGYIDRNFRVVISCRFDDAWPFSCSRGLIRRGNKYGYVALNNRMAIPARFDHGHSFNEGVACVMSGSQYGYITPNGRYIVEPKYDYARSVKNSLAYVEKDGKADNLIITNGRIVTANGTEHRE